jgi:hypothetical protein
MVETRERETVYTTDPDAGPSTALVVLFSLLIVAVLGFMVYFFSNNDLRNNPQTIIERNTSTQTTVPVPVPAPSAPAPNINVMPSTPSAPDLGTPSTSTPSSTPSGNSTTP